MREGATDVAAVYNVERRAQRVLNGTQTGQYTKRMLARDVLALAAALRGVADGLLSDPCWCGDEWWSVHDAHADEREHSDWCLAAREALGV